MKKVGKAEMNCANCWYSHPSEDDENEIECHKNPPITKEEEDCVGVLTSISYWPFVKKTMWCGEWAHIETARDELPEKVRRQI